VKEDVRGEKKRNNEEKKVYMMPENKVFRKEVERSQTSKSRRTNQQNMQDQKKEPE
jgi:hypothetical protein